MTVQLYHGDCLEVLPTLAAGSVDAVVCDPPYGINYTRGGGRSSHGWTDFRTDGDWDAVKPTPEYFAEILRVGRKVVIWGGNYFADMLPASSGWLVWDKGQRNFSLADCELAWTNQDKACRIFDCSRAKALQDRKVHPTQKPVTLMTWCMEILKLPQDATVLDPYMGSGTTGVACVQTCRNFIGIEKEEGYYCIAQKRIAAAEAQLNLFAEAS